MKIQIEHYKYIKNAEVNQEKIKFYMNMSHELRTPLSLIIAPLEELVEQSELINSKIQSKLKFIYQNCQRLLHIINQLLELRKAEAGVLPIQIALYDIEDLCSQIISMFTDKALKRNLVANNGKAAMDILENQEVDMELSNVMIPEINSLKICEMIKQNL